MPEAEARDDAGGDRDDVLQGAAELDAHEVLGRVEAKRGRREPVLDLAARSARAPPAITAAVGSPRATPSANVGPESAATAAPGAALANQLRHALARLRLDPLGRREEPVATAGRGRRSPRSARIEAHGTASTSVSACANASARSRGRVAPPAAARCPADAADGGGRARSPDRRRVASPEHGLEAGPRQVERERGSPRSGPEDRDLHLLPSFRSSPRARRFRFSRCLSDDEDRRSGRRDDDGPRGVEEDPGDGRQQAHRDDRTERNVAGRRHDQRRTPRCRRASARAPGRGRRRPRSRRPCLRGIRRRSERRGPGRPRAPPRRRRADRP